MPKTRYYRGHMSFDFKKAAREILRDHPEISGRTLFINPATGETNGSLLARLRGRLSDDFCKQLKAAEKAANDNKTPVADIIRHKDVSAVLLTPERETEAEALFDLHRQAARLIIPRGKNLGKFFAALFDVPQAAEDGAADAYAAIRLLQRKGPDRGFLDRLSAARAAEFIFTGDPGRLTSFVIDKALSDNTLAALKPQEVVATVEKYVAGCAPSRALSEALVKEFAPLKGKKLDDEGLKLLAGITAASKNPLATYIGRRALGEDAATKLPNPSPSTPKGNLP